MSVFRIYVEKKPEFAVEAKNLLADVKTALRLDKLRNIRILNRYDAEGLSEADFKLAIGNVFSEPAVDTTSAKLPELGENESVFAVEYLPGQFDQRADSCEQCIQILTQGERCKIKNARIYIVDGKLSASEMSALKAYIINPVESREASLDEVSTLATEYDIPTEVATLENFIYIGEAELVDFISKYGLAMDLDDIKFCQKYFKETEKRDPTITEIRMIDTYWSDHCRHTTFSTIIDNAEINADYIKKTYNEYLNAREELGRTNKPITLMDIATIAAKKLKKDGILKDLDESEEINACSVQIKVDVDGDLQDWLLMFKNETHNHPTEIEPFGGAATCLGGAIRDPLSGRSYVYQAMRVTGAANPLVPVEDTIHGKLPQRKITVGAANGYSSYGNQIGLATGHVSEVYHPGYVAKRLEIGAVIAAAPKDNVIREVPEPGDVVILLGGRTGRDGCGGATGSSKSHTEASLETCGAEVQKGNPPVERKLQRLFRNPEVTHMIRRCNDFGAGGVSVAIGELTDGLIIDLNAVPKKYDGLDGTELAISESQERMAVVVRKTDADKFIAEAEKENLEATLVAVVTEEPRLKMNWNDKTIVDLSREFLNSNGAEKHIDIVPAKAEIYKKEISGSFAENYKKTVTDLNLCSKRGLSERFDSTIGAGTVLMPFGGKYQQTPIQAMVQKISVEKGHTDNCSLMAFGYNPFITEKSPFHGAYLAVVESVCKLIATGTDFKDVYLTFQEYFERPGKDPERWGKPLAALLGAFRAQKEFGIGAIGGKDSMSGTFEKLDVPPTLVSFAVSTDKVSNIVSPEFKQSGHRVVKLSPEYDENNLPKTDSMLTLFDKVTKLLRSGKAVACYTPGMGGIAEAIFKMAIGNGLGFNYNSELTTEEIFGLDYASFLLEVTEDIPQAKLIGTILDDGKITYKDEELCISKLQREYEERLESVYSCDLDGEKDKLENITFTEKKYHAPAVKTAKPRVLIPVFPGTNCEYDSAKAVTDAGADAEIFVINNLSSDGIARSVESFASEVANSQMIFIPGGFSGGDEPDGSGKFITAFFRNSAIKEQVTELLEKRDGLMIGICNGFQALIKLGLVPFGKIMDTDAHCPTLTFNSIGRHQSRIVTTRVASANSPWLSGTRVGELYNVPISHGEGRFIAEPEMLAQLISNGQVATQYVDAEGDATNDILYNPNGSVAAIEGILSPDGRVLGKMGHSERIGSGLYKNVPGNYDMQLFKSAVRYFK